MKLLPVLDVCLGEAVHAAGGDRSRYRPVESVLTPTSDPLSLARAFRDKLGLTELYLADLDAIAGQEPQWELFRALAREGFSLWVDAGVRDRHLALGLSECGVRTVVAGLETLRGPDVLPELVEGLGPDGFVLSLDLRLGRPIGDPQVWGPRDAAAIAASAYRSGARRFLVLDLARVGAESGPPVEETRAVADRCPGAQVFAGGGVRTCTDLEVLRAAGAAGALVATAFHKGAIDRAALAALCV